MDIDIQAILERVENRSFAEKCNYYFVDSAEMKEYFTQHLIIFEIDNDDRREIFNSELIKTNYIAFDDDIDTPKSEYDYRFIEDLKFTPKTLFNLFKSHNNKISILDADTLLAKQSLVDILQGAICSSPDSGSKWSVSLNGEKNFMFRGTVILLTTLSREKFAKTKKYHYLNRDMRRI